MLKSVLLYLSEHEETKNFLLHLPLGRRAAMRFVAGDSQDDALEAAQTLNSSGFRVTLDLLGESVADRDEATAATDEYEASLDAIDHSPAETTISLKLTQLGLDIDEEFCFQNLLRIVQRAEEFGNFVRIDMEGAAYTEATLRIFRQAYERHKNVGTVIQAYLHRSEADIADLVRLGAPVRLCKGAYKEPSEIAFQSKAEVDASYVRLMRMLLGGGNPTGIATHDERMIDATLAFAAKQGIQSDAFELQMLYGVRRDYQRRLRDQGHAMRIYVPYGAQWYSYFMRRMAERPA
ncbi:MAG: proline dehydrogenase family protein, partial [Gemmatimonadota bacterium]